MKKLILLFSVISLFFISSVTKAQLIDEKNVTVTMDLQPILQLNMTTPDQTEFVFDEISKYYAGIIKYGATILKVSSSVSWDLYAVGTSTTNNQWDVQQEYGRIGSANSSNVLPLSALELHQYPYNRYCGLAGAPPPAGGPFVDYSLPFQPFTQPFVPVLGQNSIYHNVAPYTAPAVGEHYIQGASGIRAANDLGAPGGSYLTAQPVAGAFSDFYFVIDYRILPGLPAVFPLASSGAGVFEGLADPAYAEPGVYSMDVKYVLLEDQ
jgi:hypothetical protein